VREGVQAEVLAARRAASQRALELVASEGRVILGLGTGTTVATFVDLMVEKGAMRIVEAVIPTSRQSEELARRAGLRVASLGDTPEPDFYVDSFDQVDRAGEHGQGRWRCPREGEGFDGRFEEGRPDRRPPEAAGTPQRACPC
jgi:ribose 5-phosphate isomerase A